MSKERVDPVVDKEDIANESWKDIEGYEGLYMISSFGRILSLKGWNGRRHIDRRKILKGWIQKIRKDSHYCRRMVTLIDGNGNRQSFKVHRLVAKAFVENPHGHLTVNHLDGNPLNNIASNLEWCTQMTNVQHARKMGLMKYNTDTITREALVEQLNSGKTYDEISADIDCAKGTLFNLIKRLGIKRIYI